MVNSRLYQLSWGRYSLRDTVPKIDIFINNLAKYMEK